MDKKQRIDKTNTMKKAIYNFFSQNKDLIFRVIKKILGITIKITIKITIYSFSILGLISFTLWLIGYRQFMIAEANIDWVAVGAIGSILAFFAIILQVNNQGKIQKKDVDIRLYDKRIEAFGNLKNYIKRLSSNQVNELLENHEFGELSKEEKLFKNVKYLFDDRCYELLLSIDKNYKTLNHKRNVFNCYFEYLRIHEKGFYMKIIEYINNKTPSDADKINFKILCKENEKNIKLESYDKQSYNYLEMDLEIKNTEKILQSKTTYLYKKINSIIRI